MDKRNIKTILLATFLFTNTSYAVSMNTGDNKENLKEAKQQLIKLEKLCVDREHQIKSDPFIIKMSASIKQDIMNNEFSEIAGERILKVINFTLKTVERVCDKLGDNLTELDRQIKFEGPIADTSILDFENESVAFIKEAQEDIKALKSFKELKDTNKDEFDTLQIIADMMDRLLDSFANSYVGKSKDLIIFDVN